MSKQSELDELYELCKKVYERTGWDDLADDHPWITERNVLGYERNGIAPLYTSDYLLEKLPETYNKQELMLWRSGVSSWRAGYSPIESYRDDTPLKALLKLTIALSEAGELNE